MIKHVLTAAAMAAALTLAMPASAQQKRESTVKQLVQPTAGRQTLPVGTVIQGGTDLGTSIAGATVVLPNRQVVYDVVVGQVLRDNQGLPVGGTITSNVTLVPLVAAADTGTRGANTTTTQVSPGLIGAVALGAALALGGGGGGSSTVTHGGAPR